MENQRNQQGEMVDDQTMNKTVKSLNKRKRKKKNHQLRNWRITFSIVLVLHFLASHPVCLCLLDRFGSSIWCYWSPVVVGSGWVAGAWRACWVVAWWASGHCLTGQQLVRPMGSVHGRSAGQRPVRPVGWQPGGVVAQQACGMGPGRVVGLQACRAGNWQACGVEAWWAAAQVLFQ
jgi:hypothetical protein